MQRTTQDLQLVSYDQTFLDKSWHWLNDVETRALTMSPVFGREDQARFFESLPRRQGYLIWGLSLAGLPIGATGLKNHRGSLAEYWGYIGEKDLWGQGLGSLLMALVEQKAREHGFHELDLRVSVNNDRAIRLYKKMGYKIVDQSADKVLTMIKRSIL